MKTNIFVRILVVCLALCLCLSSFAACKDNDDGTGDSDTVAGTDSGDDSQASSEPGDCSEVKFSVTVKADNGTVFEGIGVYVYEDAAKDELVWFAKTDVNGAISFAGVSGAEYTVALEGVSEGYVVEDSYSITAESTDIVLVTEMATDADMNETKLSLGDIIFDFSVTDPEGKEHKLSELLKEKEIVVLNFWYTNCNPCRQEFGYMQESYEQYSDKIEIVAMNPIDKDDAEIAAFKDQYGLSFVVAQCESEWEKVMQLTAYPTTVVIDRYGMIKFIHSGKITETETFNAIFDYFTGENAAQNTVEDIEDILSAAATAEPSSDATETPGTDAPGTGSASTAAPGTGSPSSGSSSNTSTSAPSVDNTYNKNISYEFGMAGSHEVTIGAGYKAFVNIYGLVGNLVFTLKSSNVNVVYSGKTYTPANGVVSFGVTSEGTFTPVYLEIKNIGSATETFSFSVTYKEGTIGNPYNLSIGKIDAVSEKGNGEGLCYIYKSGAKGVLTLKGLGATAGAEFDISLHNLSTNEYVTLGEEGTSDGSVSINVASGEEVRVIISAKPDSNGEYPATTISVLASFAKSR